MTSVFKIAYIEKLDDIVIKYNKEQEKWILLK